MADLLHGIQNRLVGVLRTAGVLSACVDVITVRVNDMPMARAYEAGWRLVISLAWAVSILPAAELQELRDLHS